MPSNLNLDYYHGTEAEQFNFCRVPKILLTDPRYKSVSIENGSACAALPFYLVDGEGAP